MFVVYIYNPWKKRVPREKFARMASFAWDHEIRHYWQVCRKQACNNIDITSLVQLKFNKLVPTTKLSTSCNKLVGWTTLVQYCHNKLATSLSTTCYKSVTTTWDKQCEQILQQVCWNKLPTTLLAGLLQLVRFYVCRLFKHKAAK